jgi:hypothetical protein
MLRRGYATQALALNTVRLSTVRPELVEGPASAKQGFDKAFSPELDEGSARTVFALSKQH